MSRVKMRHCHHPEDAARMALIREELAELMGRMFESDSPRYAPIYAAWAAADVCARDLVEPAPPHPEMGLDDRVGRGRPETADIERLKDLHDRAQRMNVLLHPSAAMAGPLLAVALTIRAAAQAWSGRPDIWREQRGV